MIARPKSMDHDSKRWLTFLAVMVAASASFMAYALIKTLSPPAPSETVTAKPTRAQTAGTARSEPDWNAPVAGQRSLAVATRADPFVAQDAASAKAAIKNDPVAAQQAVHHEAEYLRNLISQGKLPKSYGNLTKEQVDQMEKDGIMIN